MAEEKTFMDFDLNEVKLMRQAVADKRHSEEDRLYSILMDDEFQKQIVETLSNIEKKLDIWEGELYVNQPPEEDEYDDSEEGI
jgi:hypothetical protein